MKYRFLIILFVCLTTYLKSQSGLRQIMEFGENPGNLNMYYFKPNEKKNKKPLVLVLHGCSQDAETAAQQTGWNKLAKLHDFYVVYPEQKRANNLSRCFNWFFRNNYLKDKGEVASIKEMILYMQAKHNIDTSKIFITGLSAGASMSVSVMACYPELINTGAIVAGGPYHAASNALNALKAMSNPNNNSAKHWGELVKSQNPEYQGKYPKMIIIHGIQDDVVNIENANQLIKQWSYLLNTDTIPSKVDSTYNKHKAIQKQLFYNTDSISSITYYKIDGIRHSLCIKPGEAEDEGGELLPFTKDIGWHSTYQIALDFGLIKL